MGHFLILKECYCQWSILFIRLRLLLLLQDWVSFMNRIKSISRPGEIRSIYLVQEITNLSQIEVLGLLPFKWRKLFFQTSWGECSICCLQHHNGNNHASDLFLRNSLLKSMYAKFSDSGPSNLIIFRFPKHKATMNQDILQCLHNHNNSFSIEAPINTQCSVLVLLKTEIELTTEFLRKQKCSAVI